MRIRYLIGRNLMILWVIVFFVLSIIACGHILENQYFNIGDKVFSFISVLVTNIFNLHILNEFYGDI